MAVRLRVVTARHDTGTERRPEHVEELELRRHAPRDPHADRLSHAGRVLAEDVGRAATRSYDRVFVSPAERAAETAAWFLRGAMQQLPDHAVVPGLAGQDASGGSPEGMAAGVRALLDQLPAGGVGLAISHTPLVERAAFGLTGSEVQPFAECEGILVRRDDDGGIAVTEIRLDRPGPAGEAGP
jgi:phosphohistidine phosphatase SixA